MSADPIKVYDARWERADFTPAQITRLAEATLLYARELGVDTLTLSRDARLGGPEVLGLFLEEALRQGFRVYLTANPVSTPHHYFLTHWVTLRHARCMGLTITASHNPAAYIGVKFTIPTVQAIGLDCGPRGGLTRVRELYHSGEQAATLAGGTLTLVDLLHEYLTFSLKTAEVAEGALRGLKVVLDGCNGSAGPEIMLALQRAGAEVFPLRLIPDGEFPTGSPNPTSQGKMEEAAALAAARGAQAFIGVDGDGDRIVFGDPHGPLAAGFAAIPILQASGLTANQTPWPVLYDPKVNPLALAEWGRLNLKPVLFRNGHSQIKDYMRQIGAPAAAEESGHYYHRITLEGATAYTENSALAVLQFLHAVKQDAALLGRLRGLQEQVFTSGEFNYQFADDGVRDQAIAALVEHFRADGASTKTATDDGIDLQGTCLAKGVTLDPGRVQLDAGWYSGYVRVATNEKAVVRSYFSAGENATGRRVVEEARSLLETRFKGRTVE